MSFAKWNLSTCLQSLLLALLPLRLVSLPAKPRVRSAPSSLLEPIGQLPGTGLGLDGSIPAAKLGEGVGRGWRAQPSVRKLDRRPEMAAAGKRISGVREMLKANKQVLPSH